MSEMNTIIDYIEQMQDKTIEEQYEAFYTWAVTGQLSPDEHRLIAKYIVAQDK